MSLYNSIFGYNKYASYLLSMLGLEMSKIPRFRECFVDENDRIVIMTRTGGGNRKFYESEAAARKELPEAFQPEDAGKDHLWNCDLRQIPNYQSDEDASFDETYAYFRYEVPGHLKEGVAAMREGQGWTDPGKRFMTMLSDLQGRKDTPDTRKALEVGTRIFDAIDKNPHGGIIEV